MKRLAGALMVFALLGAAGCGDGDGGTPDVAACKAAMKKDFETATASPEAPSASRPAACKGVDDATVQRLAEEILGEEMGGG